MREKSARVTQEFVNGVLLPYVQECRWMKEPMSRDVGALAWAYQRATGNPICLIEVLSELRRRLREVEFRQGQQDDVRVVTKSIRAVLDVMPAAVFDFTHLLRSGQPT